MLSLKNRGIRPFLVCIHDATPAYDREIRMMIQDLAPLIGKRFSFAVVPNWYGTWHLATYPDYCQMIRECSEELLLHGYSHQRQRGRGPITWLTGGSDEMNGLNFDETRHLLKSGHRIFTETFGEPAQGFLAPGWQSGQVLIENGKELGLEYMLSFFSLTSSAGRHIPLATWTWDCGRWGWLGHVGHGIGWLLNAPGGRVPTLAIHPRDLERGFRGKILGLVRALLESGHEPCTGKELLTT